MPAKLGIVAGGGMLPAGIAAACRRSGREFFVVAIEGHADPKVVAGLPHAWVRLGAGGKAIALLHREGVTDVVLAGAVRRPSLAELKPDLRTARFAAKGFFNRGDDGLLSAVVKLLEDEEGFKVVAAQDILEGVLAAKGELGELSPSDRDKQDIERGVGVLDALAGADVGQAVAVQDGVVLGVEAAEGTDRLILRCGELSREGRGPVLVKLPKTGQEQRVDLPTLGPTTVANLAQAGFVGAAFAAGETLMVEAEATVAAADAAGLFLLGLNRAGR
jgi:DUF1009 family protein